MAGNEKEKKNTGGYDKFLKDLKAGTLENIYIFHGGESYLRQQYLEQVRAALVPEGFAAGPRRVARDRPQPPTPQGQ